VKAWKPILILVILIAVLAAVKIFFLSPEKNGQATGPAGPPPPLAVNGYVAAYQVLDNEVYATGTLIANEMVSIRPEVAGKLIYLNIPEGQTVVKGQLIAKLNDADLKAQVRKLQVQMEVAQSKEERAKKLLAVNGLSIEEYEDALNNLNVLKAEVDYLQTLIDKTEIRAPFNGRVGFKLISDGSYVSPSDVLTNLHQVNPIKLEFSIPERYAPEIRTGNVVDFKVDGFTQDFKATVYAIEPAIDANSRSVVLRAKADNGGNLLKPGAFARIELITSRTDKAIMVPTQAVIPILKGQQVLTAVNGEVVPKKVLLGVRNEKYVQIIDGIQAGDTIITTGLMSLRPGSKVIIKNITE
jgi:membrane fusion protein (multidrug efflux system)